MIFEKKPADFNPKISVAGCLIEHAGRYLLLKRPRHKSHPGTWQAPGGKQEKGETPLETTLREVKEEIGLTFKNLPTLFRRFYVRYPDHDFIYDLFETSFTDPIIVEITDEHEEYGWFSIDEIFSLPIVPGGKEVLEKYLKKS